MDEAAAFRAGSPNQGCRCYVASICNRPVIRMGFPADIPSAGGVVRLMEVSISESTKFT